MLLSFVTLLQSAAPVAAVHAAATSPAAAQVAAQPNPQGALLIWGCILLVILMAFGSTAYHKLCTLNKKHHVIEWDNDSIYVWDDDDDYE
ncbi:secreted protein [gut metagenome]|uniref:Secreted protein n=1 Tax=gut metagenome TaxID=749906 RepID=J9GRP2_9ZZZZ